MMRINMEIIIPILFGIVSGILFYFSLQLPNIPGYFPERIFALMLFFSFLQLVLAIANKESAYLDIKLMGVCFVFISVIYAVSMPAIGFIPTTIIYMAICIFMVGEKSKWLLILPLATAFSVYFVFTKGFFVPLPDFDLAIWLFN